MKERKKIDKEKEKKRKRKEYDDKCLKLLCFTLKASEMLQLLNACVYDLFIYFPYSLLLTFFILLLQMTIWNNYL